MHSVISQIANGSNMSGSGSVDRQQQQQQQPTFSPTTMQACMQVMSAMTKFAENQQEASSSSAPPAKFLGDATADEDNAKNCAAADGAKVLQKAVPAMDAAAAASLWQVLQTAQQQQGGGSAQAAPFAMHATAAATTTTTPAGAGEGLSPSSATQQDWEKDNGKGTAAEAAAKPAVTVVKAEMVGAEGIAAAALETLAQ